MSDKIETIVMPKWGLAMQEGMVAKWHVAEGDSIKKGQEVVDIETSKIANVFESPVDGKVRRLVVGEGETVPVAYLIAAVAPDSVSDADVDAFVADFKANFVVPDAGAGGPLPETVETAAGRVNFLKMGDAEGDPILFIHGYGGDLNNWMFNQEDLSADFTTYAIDLLGHGGSTKDVGKGDVESLARAVLAFLDSQNVKKAHLVGHSMGGATALLLATKHPERVASATLIATGGLGAEINMDYINGFIEEKRAKKLRPVMELLVANPEMISKDMVEDVLKFKRLDGVDQALKTIRDAVMPGGKQAGDLRGALGDLKVPVQVIAGKADQIIPPAHTEGLPKNVKVTVFDGAGHMPHMEKSAEVNALIRSLAG